MKYRRDSGTSEALSALLILDGSEFIDGSFKMFLGRPADAGAVEHYSKHLEKNNNKMQILSDILKSKEALSRPQMPEVMDVINRYRKRVFWKTAWKSRKNLFLKKVAPPPVSVHSINQELIDQFNIIRNEQLNISHNLIHQINRLHGSVQRIEYQLDGNHFSASARVLESENRRFLINLSTSNHWRSHAVGIVRVEREIARYFRDFENVEFVIWHASSSSLRLLAPYHTQQILSEAWCEPSEGLISFDPAQLPVISLTDQDTYISVGLDWDHAPTPHVLKYLRQYGVKSILACYDLVPIKYPEFLVRDNLSQEFRQHLIEIAHGATKVFVISEASKRELLKFWDEAALEIELPYVFVVPLASYTQSSSLPALNTHDEAVMRDVFRKGEYVLYVSSFEPRKNYKMAFDIWRELWKERKSDCPQFVHVGMGGWGSNDLLSRIPRMSAYTGGKINWLQRVSDNLLAHLYANCSFTIFPSLYEGWGLAATESLSFGKACIVSNNSSLQEATQGLMPAHHPLDFPSWKMSIDRLLDDGPYRLSLEDDIRRNYKHKSWDDFGKAFSENLSLDVRA